MRLLVIEDEIDLNNILCLRLTKANYCVDSCKDGQEAWEYIQSADYDGIIMDIMLPHMNGITILKKMRTSNRNTPVLLLTAKDSINDRVTGLDCGADDYLVKPFAFDELLARIRVMTRKQSKQKSNIYTLADLSVNINNHKVTRGGNDITLTSKEFAILEYLIKNQGIVLSKDTLEQHIWNYDYNGESNIIKVYIRYLRRKIDDGFEKKLIHTIRNYGYVLRT